MSDEREAPTVEGRTQFNYLLNAFEVASQSPDPATNNYGEKRKALFAYVRGLEAGADARAVSADAARLDWLDAQRDLFFDCFMQGGKMTHILRQHWGASLGYGPTPRAAIDAAMAGSAARALVKERK